MLRLTGVAIAHWVQMNGKCNAIGGGRSRKEASSMPIQKLYFVK